MTIGTTGAPRQLRRVPLLAETARLGITAHHAALSGTHLLVSQQRGRGISRQAARQARRRFAALGPAYVKLGQLIASSPGVFPDVLADEFRSLLDRVPAADPGLIERVLTTELGAPPHEFFATFDPVPIASASIAQVHRATLTSGAQVVVKIRRPGIGKRLAADVQILARIAALAEYSDYGRMLGARDIIDDFAANLDEELDFRNEAQAMHDWRNAVRGSIFAERVRAPHVYWEYSGPKVLVMEYIDAVRIDDAAALATAGHDGERLLSSLLLSLLDSAFRRGVFHGDLHAGNVLVDPEGRVVLLDWGIVGRFDDRRRVILRRLVSDLMVYNDFDAAAKAAVQLGAIGRPGNRAQAAADVRAFTKPISGSELGKVSYADIGSQLARLGREYQVRMPRDLVLVGKQFLYIERYMKLLAPRWKPISDEEIVGYMAGLIGEAESERDGDAAEIN